MTIPRHGASSALTKPRERRRGSLDRVVLTSHHRKSTCDVHIALERGVHGATTIDLVGEQFVAFRRAGPAKLDVHDHVTHARPSRPVERRRVERTFDTNRDRVERHVLCLGNVPVGQHLARGERAQEKLHRACERAVGCDLEAAASSEFDLGSTHPMGRRCGSKSHERTWRG